MGYLRPVNAPISDDRSEHLARSTPSAEPGTDYACGYGTPILAAASGTVVDRQTHNGNATGRFVTIDLDDGRRVRYLHLASVEVKIGDRVSRGQRIAVSGASANGNDWGVGPHVHVTLWPSHGYVFNNSRSRSFTGTLDFEQFADGVSADGAMSTSEAQEFLKSLGLYDGAIDGDPGPKTKAGTKTFQEWVGLLADSIFGPDTSGVARVIIAGEKQVSRSTREIQQYLQRRGLFHNWAADDDWGNQCSCGTYRFQRAEGLTTDAKWGPISDGRAFPTVPSTPTAPPATPQLDPAQPWKHRTPDSPLATWVGSPNYGYREPAPVKTHITLHWMDGTLAGTDAHFQNPGTIKDGRGTGTSTQYGIGQTEIHQYVPEGEYAHGDGDAYSNANGISIEHEGGPDRPITDAVYDLSARLVADIAARHQLGELKVGVNVFPHNHWVATECPGTLDLDRIVTEANRINGHVPEPEPEQPTPTDPEPDTPEEEPMPTEQEPTPEPVVLVPLTPEQLDAFLSKANGSGIEKPAEPMVPDNVAKPLWIAFGLTVASAGPIASVLALTGVLDVTVADQAASIVVGWAGSVAAFLGLSRYAKTKA
jgi:murein DD-endopeptidase MepM/ murein hydrolase activator NlpD